MWFELYLTTAMRNFSGKSGWSTGTETCFIQELVDKNLVGNWPITGQIRNNSLKTEPETRIF